MDRTDKVFLQKLEDELKKVVRRVETMQKSLDLLYEDRGILEDIIAKQNALQEQFALIRNRYDKNTQDIRQEITGVGETMAIKADEGTAEVTEKLGLVVNSLADKKVIELKPNFITKIRQKLKL